MEKYYSKDNPDVLLHIINRVSDINGRENLSPDNEFLQLASMKMKSGTTFKPHKHIWKSGREVVIAQESWVVISGSVRVIFYDLDDSLLTSSVLCQGDCSVTFQGGHNYEILEEDTLVYEYKTGPYTGQNNDKEFIDD